MPAECGKQGAIVEPRMCQPLDLSMSCEMCCLADQHVQTINSCTHHDSLSMYGNAPRTPAVQAQTAGRRPAWTDPRRPPTSPWRCRTCIRTTSEVHNIRSILSLSAHLSPVKLLSSCIKSVASHLCVDVIGVVYNNLSLVDTLDNAPAWTQHMLMQYAVTREA